MRYDFSRLLVEPMKSSTNTSSVVDTFAGIFTLIGGVLLSTMTCSKMCAGNESLDSSYCMISRAVSKLE